MDVLILPQDRGGLGDACVLRARTAGVDRAHPGHAQPFTPPGRAAA